MAKDDATTVRQAIEKVEKSINKLLAAPPRPHLVDWQKSPPPVRDGSNASPQSGISPLGSIQNLVGGLTRIFPKLGQVTDLFKPLVSGIMSLAQAAATSVVGAGTGAVAGAVGAGGATAGAIGGATGAAAAGAGAGIAALASNPVGWAVALVAAAALVTAAFLALPSATAKFLDALLDSNRQLGEVSGSMAAVLAKSDFRNILRDMRRGEALAPSANALADALGNLKDSTLDLEVTFMKIVNSLGVVLAGFAETIAGAIKMIPFTPVFNPARGLMDIQQGMQDQVKGLAMLVDVARGIDAKMPEKEGEPMGEFFNRVADWAKDAQQRNDPVFGRVQLAR